MTEQKEKVLPISRFSAGQVSTAVFVREMDGKFGKRKVPSVVLQKSWTKDGKNWEKQTLNFFNADEISKAIYVLEQARGVIYNKNYESSEEN